MRSAELAGRIQAKRRGDWYDALCPAHDDHNPSLSFKDGDRGIVFHCRKCQGREVATAMAARVGVQVRDFFWAARPSLSPMPLQRHEEPEQIYDYHDEDWRLLFEVLRYAGKRFKARRP